MIRIAVLTGCQSLTSLEEQQYKNLIDQGAKPIRDKEPVLAAALNVGPGLGNIYNGEWGAFALDPLTLYLSPVSTVPQGYAIADRNEMTVPAGLSVTWKGGSE